MTKTDTRLKQNNAYLLVYERIDQQLNEGYKKTAENGENSTLLSTTAPNENEISLYKDRDPYKIRSSSNLSKTAEESEEHLANVRCGTDSYTPTDAISPSLEAKQGLKQNLFSDQHLNLFSKAKTKDVLFLPYVKYSFSLK